MNSAALPQGNHPRAVLGPAARQAEALGAALPALLVAARRIAATVAQGVHGRRRVGRGDSFWQFRPFLPGDAVNRIDWRQSAKSDRVFVRETEWDAAQTVCIWADASPSMHWRSRLATTTKRERAVLLLLSLAALLLRGGERVQLIAAGEAAHAGRDALEALAAAALAVTSSASVPPPLFLPRQASVVLFGDFLTPLAEVRRALAALAGIPVEAHVVQIIDPAERALPFQGRVRFADLEDAGEALVPRVESVRASYAERFAAHEAGLAEICRSLGFGFTVHETDHGAEAALLALYLALAPQG